MTKREAPSSSSSTMEDREVESSNKRIKTGNGEMTSSTAAWTFDCDEYKRQSENWSELSSEERAERFK